MNITCLKFLHVENVDGFMPAKTKIANLRCPKDKWTEVYGTEENPPEDDVPDEREELLRLAAAMEKEAQKIRESLE